MNITRRNLVAKSLGGVTVLGLVSLETSCNASGLIADLDLVSAGIQAALPVLSAVLPPPYNSVLPLVGTFLNVITTAVNTTASIIQQNLPALQQAKGIEQAWAAVILSPTVLAQLPTTPISSTANASIQQLVQSLVGSANAFLNALALTVPGVSATPAANNAVLTLSGLSSSIAIRFVTVTKRIPEGYWFTRQGQINREHLRKIVKQTTEARAFIMEHTAPISH